MFGLPPPPNKSISIYTACLYSCCVFLILSTNKIAKQLFVVPGPATKSAWPPQSKSESCRTNHLLQTFRLLHYGHCNRWGLVGRENRNNLRSNAIRSVRILWVMDENKEKSFQQIWSFSLFLSYTLEQKKKEAPPYHVSLLEEIRLEPK